MTSLEDEDRAVKLAIRALELVEAGELEVSGQHAKNCYHGLKSMAGWLQSSARGNPFSTTEPASQGRLCQSTI